MIVSVPNGTDTPPDGGPASEPVSPPLVFLVGDDLDEIADVAADLESWGHDPIVQFDVSAIGNSITRVRPDVVVVIGTDVRARSSQSPLRLARLCWRTGRPTVGPDCGLLTASSMWVVRRHCVGQSRQIAMWRDWAMTAGPAVTRLTTMNCSPRT
ncbi:MAG: hypothetical protein EB039_01515, partial [Proteobacteria bacterium]|nr:hypothetical protein [Pseudomonadota bacterium]